MKTYGNPAKPALLYIHGGPRGNSTLFEGTTAQTLADRGFYVIVYDRRGEGRSADSAASFTFDEAFTDLNALLNSLKLSKVNLLGHSFGGIVASLYSEKHPEKIQRLFLIGALVNQQQSYDHILQTAIASGREQTNPAMLQRVQAIQTLDKSSAQYRGLTYQLAAELGRRLQVLNAHVTTAESCTGGGIAEAITRIPGSSAWFEAGYVTYSNAQKTRQLGVPEGLFVQVGAVSQEVVEAMVRGAQAASGARFAVAVSGVAGPDGGSPAKPVGTVWLAWGDGRHVSSERRHFDGDRDSVRRQTVIAALEGLLQLGAE